MMPTSLVRDPDDIRLALVGKVKDNDHPYSWSAIVNGFEPSAMAECPNPIIRRYMSRIPVERIGIEGVRVSHIWCDDQADAERIARTSLIQHVVENPDDVIGEVDAVLIPTDIGGEHVERCRPFIEAGLPLFVDKPLTDNESDLLQFVDWHRTGKAIMSCSCMRFAEEFRECRGRIQEAGELRMIVATTCGSWERYGMHALEAAYQFLPPYAWREITTLGDVLQNVVHLRHAAGVRAVVAAIDDLFGALGHLTCYGTSGVIQSHFKDSFSAFKCQLGAFVDYLRNGTSTFPFSETVELTRLLIAAIRSREESRSVQLSEIEPRGS